MESLLTLECYSSDPTPAPTETVASYSTMTFFFCSFLFSLGYFVTLCWFTTTKHGTHDRQILP